MGILVTPNYQWHQTKPIHVVSLRSSSPLVGIEVKETRHLKGDYKRVLHLNWLEGFDFLLQGEHPNLKTYSLPFLYLCFITLSLSSAIGSKYIYNKIFQINSNNRPVEHCGENDEFLFCFVFSPCFNFACFVWFLHSHHVQNMHKILLISHWKIED
jgi:hypothetical protein